MTALTTFPTSEDVFTAVFDTICSVVSAQTLAVSGPALASEVLQFAVKVVGSVTTDCACPAVDCVGTVLGALPVADPAVGVLLQGAFDNMVRTILSQPSPDPAIASALYSVASKFVALHSWCPISSDALTCLVGNAPRLVVAGQVWRDYGSQLLGIGR